MIRKLSMLAAAFLLGLCVSITIHACGGDKEQAPGPGGNSNTPGGGTENPGGTAGPANMWDYGSGKLLKRYEYDSTGKEYLAYEYQYDDKLRVIGMKQYYTPTGTGYNATVMGKLSFETKNYRYEGNVCTYESYVYIHDYATGELKETRYSKCKEIYLE
ncbi:hypothetical protein [Alistipes sp.]|uniref:hypothetical protein n=1 Tax=Alistipes sp. TaxID=1872444 RepID=UPI003AF1BD5F